MSTSPGLIPFAKQWAVLLTSYKQDGTPVGTPVSIVVDGDHAYVRTYATSGKAKRLRNNPEIELAPCTARGKPTGPAIKARVRLLDPGSDESKHASKMLLHEHPFMHGALVPIAHKVMRDKTLHYEVRPL
ncbi:PPOX class F420-dependent oxidoreductase [Streptomyces sp. NBC_00191]|uniref:PPOX class F420-dependent oxidoreductase n=1 Tax=Streptomyces sp. NBC_00191 TaxID=2975674 RepID=UPI003246A2FA